MIKDSKYEIFQRVLIETRQSQQLTQTEVSYRLEKPQSYVSKYESGERRLDVIEFINLCNALNTKPDVILTKAFSVESKPKSILDIWEISESDFTNLIHDNPSLRGMNLGYIAEKKFHDTFLNNTSISEVVKDCDHDRTRKGDRRIMYKGCTFIIEVKSLQTNMCKKIGDDEWTGKSQVDGSDSRVVKFSDGTELNTTLLLRGQFDILAVNCFAFGEKWRFCFAKNCDLPNSSFKKYTSEQQSNLIASLVQVSWPPQKPFTVDLFQILDELVSERENRQN